ncbi:MAG: hypothetical protein LBK71_06820 [Verrucomicrobiales bacterium]|nr:hypothetical protein [Verrucomicrobiales bacterium]
MTTPFALEPLCHGTWTSDEAGLPAFDLTLRDDDCPDMPFAHLLGTGRLSALADRWGNVNLFTTEGGFRWLNLRNNAVARSSLYLMMETGGELVSLLHSELTRKGRIRVGTGYVEYHGELDTAAASLHVVAEIFAAPDRGRVIGARFTLTNRGGRPLTARFRLCADVTPSDGDAAPAPQTGRASVSGAGHAAFPQAHPELGDVFLLADPSWQGAAHRLTLRLCQELTIPAGASVTVSGVTGYGAVPEFAAPDPAAARRQWAARLAPFAVPAPEEWMRRECLWNAGQLLSFANYDSSTGEDYVALGGYGWREFGVREVCETSMVLAAGDWALAAASLRFVAKTQLASGDVPKMHTLRRDRPPREFESDNELWFIIGACESLTLSGRAELLDEVCAFWDGGAGTLWEHLQRAFYWVRDGVGRGQHGLLLIREGDWNDYLSLMGAAGRGESLMNSGMACRACDVLAPLAVARGAAAFAREVAALAEELRAAVGAAFDQGWFLRGYTDAGQAVGSFAEDRVFINAQSWCALGKCGTPEQRRLALTNAVAKCHTDCGLTLMSRPYSSPAPDDISWCAIPAGEGENAGIWPQTIYWMVWALAEEGLLDEALTEWTHGTLRHHAQRFPAVPFGIFNGPDCFSSKWSGRREGWTQTQLVDRAHTVPMNPMVAWQGYAMRKILDRQQANHASRPA